MGTTKKKLSIDELARRMRAERCGGIDLWDDCTQKTKSDWRRVAHIARELESQPADEKPRPENTKLLACEACGLDSSDLSVREWRRFTDDDRTNRLILCEFCWEKTPSERVRLMVVARRRERAALDRAKAAAAKKARK